MKFTSRKFILTLIIVTLSAILPALYKYIDVSDAVTMMVLGVMTGVGTAYGFVNIKQKADLEEKPNESK